jgi:putative FmdB family regulatory protein
MPTYAYICSKCGHEFDLFQSMAAAPLKVCPEELCGRKRWGKGPVKRAIGAGAGLLFKGSGFYITDYRSEGYKQAAKSESSPAPTAAKAADSKPATKTEAKPAKPAAAKSPKAS